MSQPKRILIIRLSSFGDILHTLPAFDSLRRAFPAARIDWLVEQRVQSILRTVEGIDQILTLDTESLRKHPWSLPLWRDCISFIADLRRRHYDLAIDFQGLIKTGFLAFVSGAKDRVGFGKQLVREKPAHWFYHRGADGGPARAHIARLNSMLAEFAGGVSSERLVPLRAEAADSELVQERLAAEGVSSYIIINPGGGWSTKLWHPTKFAALADRIEAELRLRVLVTTGPGEGILYDQISLHCKRRPPLHLKLTFNQLIPLCIGARVLVAGDTGPFHLACALGTPVVGIFGPTSPIRNGPLSSEDEAVHRTLPCSFCHSRTCPTQNECMDISVSEVFAAVQRRLDKPIGSVHRFSHETAH